MDPEYLITDPFHLVTDPEEGKKIDKIYTEKEGFKRNIQNKGRWNYYALDSRRDSIYKLVF